VFVIGVLLDPWRRPKAGGPPAERDFVALLRLLRCSVAP
jgi:hypothetical protein